MPIESHISLLQGFNAGIGDIKGAPVTYPQQIMPVMMPMSLVFAGSGSTWLDTFASGEKRAWGMVERLYNVRVYVVEVSAKSGNLGGKIQKVNRYLDLFQSEYLRICNQGLNGPGTEGEYPILSMNEDQPGRDTGSGFLDYGQALYHGFELNVTITDQIRETEAPADNSEEDSDDNGNGD